MRKGKRRNTALFLVFCMVLSMFSAIPARAEGDDEGGSQGDETQKVGLYAAQHLETYWDDQAGCDKILLMDGYPAGYARNDETEEEVLSPIDSTNYSEVSILGSVLWIEYIDDSGNKTLVSAGDLNVAYNDGNSESPEDKTSLIQPEEVQTDDGPKTLVRFEPDEPGDYTFSYTQGEEDDENEDGSKMLTVHVAYPEVGFYSSADGDLTDTLYPTGNHLWDFWNNDVWDYTGLIKDNQSEIYVKLNEVYEEDVLELTDCRLDLWEVGTVVGQFEDGSLVADTGSSDEGMDITKYMSFEAVQDKKEEGWYKITFTQTLFSDERLAGFGLRLDGIKHYMEESGEQRKDAEDNVITDGIYGCIEGTFCPSGLYVTPDDMGYGYSSDENNYMRYMLHYPGGVNPDTAKLRLGQVEKGKNGKIVHNEYSDLSSKNIAIKAKRAQKDPNDDPKWREVKQGESEDCNWKVNGNTLEIKSYYQQDYEITIGDEHVYVRPYIESIEFFDTPVRTADPDRIETRKTEITVNEGKTRTIYLMPWVDNVDADPWSVGMNKLKIKAMVGDSDVTKKYIKKTVLTDDDDLPNGYQIDITDQAKEDFTIEATATGPCKDPESGEWIESENTLRVHINERSSLKVTPPTKTTYTEGETFDPTGMAVELVYADGTSEVLKEGYTVDPAGPLTTANTSVTVSYLGLTAPLQITVSAKAPETPSTAQPSAEGTVLSSQETGEKAEFTVTSDDSADPTVAYKGTTEKKEKSVKIPDKVVVNGITYKVTSIADNAFKGNKTITKVTVSSNITSIGKNAFANCKKLKTVTVSGNVTTVGDNAFKGCAALTKVTLPAKTKKIGNNAFSGCKKLKTLTIKSKKLTSKNISKNAFKGITSKTTIKVPASKVAAYKKLFKKKGLAKNVKVTR